MIQCIRDVFKEIVVVIGEISVEISDLLVFVLNILIIVYNINEFFVVNMVDIKDFIENICQVVVLIEE